MDPQRRVIGDGAVAIEADRIVAVGPRQEVEDAHSADRVIHAQRKVIMPGLIDAHGHAGHALVKTMGHGAGAMWSNTADYIYAEGTDEEFWHAEALLASLDRLKNGTTCGVTYFGGGTMVMRVDDSVYAAATARPFSSWASASSSPSAPATLLIPGSTHGGTTAIATPIWSTSTGTCEPQRRLSSAGMEKPVAASTSR